MKNKTLKKIALTACIISGGLMLYGNSSKEYGNIRNVTYKGWTANEGKTMLVFDSKKPIFGNLDKLNLEIGQKYDLTVKIPRWAKESVVNATPVDKD